MSDPFPVGGYGSANWQDYQNNWRKVDTDWLQTRAILRYQSGPPASGETGQSVYDFASDRIMLRSKADKWIPITAAENLVVSPITSSSPSEGVGFTHKGAVGQGLVFVPSEIITYQKFRTGASEVVLDTTGVTIKTGAATALLNTSATSLVSSIPFAASNVSVTTLNVSGLSTLLDLSARDGAFSRNVSITGTLGVTGLVTASAVSISVAPSAGDRATNKTYVDGQIATRITEAAADARYVNLTGDTMSGQLTCASDIVCGQSVRSAYFFTTTGQYNDGSALTRKDYVDQRDQDWYNAYTLPYYNGAMANANARVARSGDNMTGNLGIYNAGNIFMGEKTAHAQTYVSGIELAWWGASEFTWSANGGSLSLSHVGGADANGSSYQVFFRYTTPVGSITQNGTGAISYNSTSHGPYKADVADLDDDEAIERVKRWRPVSFRWKLDEAGFFSENGTPTGEVEHGFIAQELAQVQPTAVTEGYGTEAAHKKWVGREKISGEIDLDPFRPWMTDNSKLVPDLTAAVQALVNRVTDLTTRLAALESAA